jgi:hypothetical protein
VWAAVAFFGRGGPELGPLADPTTPTASAEGETARQLWRDGATVTVDAVKPP